MSKVLLIGLDGATFDLIKPWCEQGLLPNLARLMRQGTHGTLCSVPNMNSGPAWTSIVTGVNPGKHGIFGLWTHAESSYDLRPLTARDRRHETLWHILSRARQRVIVFNVPLSYPADVVNGVMISGGDAPNPHSKGFTYPLGLVDEILNVRPDYMLAARIDGLARAGKWREAVNQLELMIDTRTDIARYLMSRYPWEFCMVVFTASDVVQHYFWHHLDTEHNPIRRIYIELDGAIGKLLAHIDSNTTVLVISDHGFGPVQEGIYYLNSFFERMGWVQYKSDKRGYNRLLNHLFFEARKHISQPMREWLVGLLGRFYQRVSTDLRFQGIDWRGTRAYAQVGDSAIWINECGRLPYGLVSSGTERAELCAEIRAVLSTVVDPCTGMAVIEEVLSREDIYWGPYLTAAPDLLVKWRETGSVTGMQYHDPTRGEITVTEMPRARTYAITGNHRENGIFIASGAQVRPGTCVKGATVYNITPTVLTLLDLPVPNDTDGKILHEAITLKDATGYSACETVIPIELDVDEDMSKVEERLRALGYIE